MCIKRQKLVEQQLQQVIVYPIGGIGGVSAGIDSNGVVHACLKGEVAAGVGLKGDLCIHIDTKAVDNDGKTVIDYANKAWNDTFGKL